MEGYADELKRGKEDLRKQKNPEDLGVTIEHLTRKLDILNACNAVVWTYDPHYRSIGDLLRRHEEHILHELKQLNRGVFWLH